MYRRRVLGAKKEDDASQLPVTEVASQVLPEASLKDLNGEGSPLSCGSPIANVQGCPGSSRSTRTCCSNWTDFRCGNMEKPGVAKTERKQQRRMLHQLHRCMAQSGVVAFSLSASALQRRMDKFAKLDEVSKFKSRRGGLAGGRLPDAGTSPMAAARFAASVLCSYLVHLVALLSLCIRNVQEAIGDSPLRRQRLATSLDLSDEVPLALFWAVNIVILCSLACGILVAMSFFAQVFAVSDEMAIEEPQPQEVSSGPVKVMRLSLRIIMVALVSFTSGMGLRVIHPIQSAMLCGL
mmetsp:Transcript_116574/g.277143  ORF Transcript_116574/g.277143 Transcript_116574/m.277143 type:complete len:294 (-) Transcript_116574:72-953(-)